MALNAVRATLAVLLALALLAAALPAVESAADARAAAVAEADAERIAATVDALSVSDSTGDLPGARRAVELRLDGVLADRMAYVAVGGRPGGDVAADGPNRDVVVYRLRGRAPRVGAVLPVELRAIRNGTPAGDDDPLVVRSEATVVFRLDECDGAPVVHTFIRGDGTTRGRG